MTYNSKTPSKYQNFTVTVPAIIVTDKIKKGVKYVTYCQHLTLQYGEYMKVYLLKINQILNCSMIFYFVEMHQYNGSWSVIIYDLSYPCIVNYFLHLCWKVFPTRGYLLQLCYPVITQITAVNIYSIGICDFLLLLPLNGPHKMTK